MRNSKLRNHILCAIFTALIAIGAFIRIPVPVVPFTLQFLFTTLAGVLLGSRLGATSVVLYIALGLLGVPVFAEGGGPGYMVICRDLPSAPIFPAILRKKPEAPHSKICCWAML